MRLLKSKGLKRLAASGLIAAAGVAAFIPGLSSASDYLAQAAGALGVVGVGHAVLKDTTYSFKLASLAAFLAALAEALKYIPDFAHYAEYVKWLAALLGAGALGNKVVKSK